MEYEQTLHRDGTSDLVIEVTSDNPDVSQEIEEEFEEEEFLDEVPEEYHDNVDYEILDDGMKIVLEDIDFTEEVIDSDEDVEALMPDVHDFTEDASLFSVDYRYEIPIDNFGDEFMSPEFEDSGFLDDGGHEHEIAFSETNEPQKYESNEELTSEDVEHVDTAEGVEYIGSDVDDDVETMAGFEEYVQGMFDMTYRLNVFADIDETNGEVIDDRTVEFDLMEIEEDVLYVEFSENRVLSWFKSLF